MFIEAFTIYLKNNLPLPTGTIIQAISLNSGQKNGVMVMAPINGFNKRDYGGEIFFGEVQIIVRNVNAQSGYQIAEVIYDFLNDENNSYSIDLGRYNIRRLQCSELPVIYPRNDSDLYECSIHADVVFIRN